MAIVDLDVDQYEKLKTVKEECDIACAKAYENSLIYFQDNMAIVSIQTLLNAVSQDFLGEILSVKKCAVDHDYKNAIDNLTDFVSTIKTDVMYIYTEIYEKVISASSSAYAEERELYDAEIKKIQDKIDNLALERTRYITNRSSYNNVSIPSQDSPDYSEKIDRKNRYAKQANESARRFNQGVVELRGLFPTALEILERSLKNTSPEGNSVPVPSI